ncbi:hypothetical protein RJT34_03604 [Clitoria ternatea]|uniref:Tf2-1-like SH3-like domain-containing protein n=1 Tax=Clitoria ternatea TaxID=43366 RepID=A0AAN9KK39_CLITE
MLRACVLEQGGSWERYLRLVEFTYNNSYHSSIGMAPYEALYGRRCHTPLCWNKNGDAIHLGPELIREMNEQVVLIREKIKIAQDRQKSYYDNRHRPLEFQAGDWVFLKVSPTKGVGRILKSHKLNPRYIGPYQILKRIGSETNVGGPSDETGVGFGGRTLNPALRGCNQHQEQIVEAWNRGKRSEPRRCAKRRIDAKELRNYEINYVYYSYGSHSGYPKAFGSGKTFGYDIFYQMDSY